MGVPPIFQMMKKSRSKSALLSTVMTAALLQGCSWFFDEDQPERVPATSSTQGTGSYPNLGSVPQSGPTVTPPAQRKQLQEGLAADTANATHSGPPLTGQDQNVAAAPAPGAKPAQPVTQEAAAPGPASSATPAPSASAPPPAQNTDDIFTPVVPGGRPSNAALAAASSNRTPTPSTLPQASTAPRPAATTAASQQQAASGSAVTVDYSAIGDSDAGYAQPAWQAPSGGIANAPYLAPGLAGVIYFGNGSSGLDNQDLSVLQAIAQSARAYGYRIQIVGHASQGTHGQAPSAGVDATNQRLSLARADSVAKTLARLGVPVQQIAIGAFGANAPAFPEYDRNGEAANRRVEIFLF